MFLEVIVMSEGMALLVSTSTVEGQKKEELMSI